MPRVEQITEHASVQIRIEGLSELRRALKDMDGALPKVLRVALNKAVSTVTSDAARRIPKRTGRTAATIKGASTQTKARVRGGGNRAPHFGWLDFGGKRVGRGGGVAERQFRDEGRYIWKSFKDNRKNVMEALQEALRETARQAGLEVSRGGQ